jgi:hypothetical protein
MWARTSYDGIASTGNCCVASESGGSGIAFFVDNITNIDCELNCKKQRKSRIYIKNYQ